MEVSTVLTICVDPFRQRVTPRLLLPCRPGPPLLTTPRVPPTSHTPPLAREPPPRRTRAPMALTATTAAAVACLLLPGPGGRQPCRLRRLCLAGEHQDPPGQDVLQGGQGRRGQPRPRRLPLRRHGLQGPPHSHRHEARAGCVISVIFAAEWWVVIHSRRLASRPGTFHYCSLIFTWH
jgi:hypothetical protein